MDKRVLVTGALGFMGSHLIDRLKELGYYTFGLDKKNYSSTSEWNYLSKLINWKPDYIVHLGANCSSQISLRDPRMDFYDNALGTVNVCELSRLCGNVPIIFNSTMKVYPGEDGIIPPYGQSKIIGETYLKLYNELYGVPYVINRPSSVYGPRQDGSDDGGWVTWFIKASLENKVINLYGDGSQSRDILYIDDCIDMLVDEVVNFGIYNGHTIDWGGGLENELSLNELLDILNYHNTETKPKLKGDVQRFIVDNTKTSSINGWKPKVSCRDGVQRTIEWFKDNL
jgi:CDP-paratose 2-epimerase